MRIILGILAVAALTGCASTGYQRAAKTSTSLKATRAEATLARKQVTDTLALLEQMANAPQADLRPLYTQFDRAVTDLERAAERAGTRANAYRANANAYVTAWADELSTIESEDMRKLSTQRRAEAMENFAAIERASAATRAAYWPFIEDLQGIRRHLGQDLTAGGVTAIQPNLAKARTDAGVLQQCIDTSIDELSRVAALLAPSAP